MEREALEPLSREQAKMRVRAAANAADVPSWVWSYPKEATLGAFIIGLIIGMSPTAREALGQELIALLKRARL